MGWKTVKKEFQIGHIVCVVEGKGICIGSPYIHDIIVIGLDGTVQKRYLDGRGINSDLHRYMEEFDAAPERLKEAVLAKDEFSQSIPVYTYNGENIELTYCEELGWPNCTHDGRLMYENMFHPDPQKVRDWAIREEQSCIRWRRERLHQLREDLARVESDIEKSKLNIGSLLGFESK